MHDYPYEHRVLPYILQDKAQEHGDRLFLLGDYELSYAALRDRAAAFAGGLLAHGVRRGDRILFLLPNIVETIITALGISWAGAVSVPVNTSYRGEMLRYVIDDADASFLVIHQDHLQALADVAGQLTRLPRLIVAGEDEAVALPAGLAGGAAPVPWTAIASGHPAARPDLGPADLQAIMYTSGTTGPSKGVLVSYHHAYQYANPTGTHLVGEADVVYVTLPLFHIGGQWAGIYAALLADGQAVLKRKFSVTSFWSDIDKYGITQTILLGVMSEFIWKQPPRDDDGQHTLRRVAVTPPPKDAAAFAERFQLRICQGWGLTEAGCVTAPPAMIEPAADPTSCGRVRTDLFEMILADENDYPVPPGTPGQALIRPVQPSALMAGYWRKPQATVDAWRNLWLHTGDVLVQNPDGSYKFVDRQKDCIRRRGENISSLEVEQAVLGHPDVLECAAIPVPGEDAEEEVKVVVTLRGPDRLTAEQLSAFLEPRMAAFMLPRFIEIVPELPKTPTQKIRKDVLRAAGMSPGTWQRPSTQRKAG
jgi:crotonobetaine/carnitine-CoA ligase